MALSLIIRSIFEFIAVVLAIVGFVYRKKLLDFENKLFRAIAIHYRNYKKRKAFEKKIASLPVQSRAKPDPVDTGLGFDNFFDTDIIEVIKY